MLFPTLNIKLSVIRGQGILMFAAQEEAWDKQGDRRLFALIGYDNILVVNLDSDFRGDYSRDKI